MKRKRIKVGGVFCLFCAFFLVFWSSTRRAASDNQEAAVELKRKGRSGMIVLIVVRSGVGFGACRRFITVSIQHHTLFDALCSN
jgi:hypothetical protein